MSAVSSAWVGGRPRALGVFVMHKQGRTVRVLARLGVGLAMVVAGLVALPTTSQASNPVDCIQGAGNISTKIDPATKIVTWSLSGQGTCDGLDAIPPFTVSVSGTATSASDGYCTGSVATLDIVFQIAATYTEIDNGAVTTQNDTWTVPITLGTVTLPFVVGGDSVGTGTMWTRIFAQCPTAGSPVATFDWVQTV